MPAGGQGAGVIEGGVGVLGEFGGHVGVVEGHAVDGAEAFFGEDGEGGFDFLFEGGAEGGDGGGAVGDDAAGEVFGEGAGGLGGGEADFGG